MQKHLVQHLTRIQLLTWKQQMSELAAQLLENGVSFEGLASTRPSVFLKRYEKLLVLFERAYENYITRYVWLFCDKLYQLCEEECIAQNVFKYSCRIRKLFVNLQESSDKSFRKLEWDGDKRIYAPGIQKGNSVSYAFPIPFLWDNISIWKLVHRKDAIFWSNLRTILTLPGDQEITPHELFAISRAFDITCSLLTKIF